MKSYHVTSVWFQRIFLHTAQRIRLTSKGDAGEGGGGVGRIKWQYYFEQKNEAVM